MPAAVQETNKAEHSDQMWKVLKIHLLRERARKKQEREQEVEEERLRKEREAREQQDVMTLGETREQISQLETKLQQLKEEKHQLFLQLKKVLNEDDNRRRQLVKENACYRTEVPTIAPRKLYKFDHSVIHRGFLAYVSYLWRKLIQSHGEAYVTAFDITKVYYQL
ncbi:unnamed protein product [Acanthoscelides obtectus]|uniref:Uncharacterized protein n=1 Tax=Acanthoscelides obtectus TaxID=200917 RepID=A0A9P0P7P8_ACAOB|nr:unnamed protein product [Acanthoscelides obtectus]CAK1681668.1 G protein pathway suppressor 2 [Acanthoscelides obtectus]